MPNRASTTYIQAMREKKGERETEKRRFEKHIPARVRGDPRVSDSIDVSIARIAPLEHFVALVVGIVIVCDSVATTAAKMKGARVGRNRLRRLEGTEAPKAKSHSWQGRKREKEKAILAIKVMRSSYDWPAIVLAVGKASWRTK